MNADELKAIRAGIERLDQKQQRYNELSNKPYKECTQAELTEGLELERDLQNMHIWRRDVTKLLAHIERQQTVIDAARGGLTDVRDVSNSWQMARGMADATLMYMDKVATRKGQDDGE